MEQTRRERSRRGQMQAVLCFFLIFCGIAWGQPDDEGRDPELSVLRIAGEANGSNAPHYPAEPMDGGDGGVIEVCTAVDVPLVGGATEDLSGSMFLPSGEYLFRQVATPERIAANFDWSMALPLTLRVQGEVVIYCDGLFDAQIEGDFSLGAPSVTVYAGDPVIHGSNGNRLSHNVYLKMSAPENPEPLDGGHFRFYTSAVGRAPYGHPMYGYPSLGDHATLEVTGGESRYGGSGGRGGAIRVCSRGPGLVAMVSGGDGSDAMKPGGDGGRGGDAGEISVATNGAPGRALVSCRYSAGKGGNGGAGMLAPDPTDANDIGSPGQGGDGGTGARIAVSATEIYLDGQVMGGHGGQGGGARHAGQQGGEGGVGGQAGSIWCEADIVDFGVVPDLRGGNGGAGGNGASGGDGGRGGDGGPGGTIDCLATDVIIDGAWAYGGKGGRGGNGGLAWSEAGGRGGDGGLGGEAAHLIGLEAILQPLGLVPGTSVSRLHFPSGLNFLWFDGQPGQGGNGGGSGTATAGNGGDGCVGGDGGNALYLEATAGNGGDACTGCSGTGLCVVIDSYGWPGLDSVPPRPGRGGEGYGDGPGGADGGFSDCDFNPAIPLEKPQMPCNPAEAVDSEGDLEDSD